MTLTIRTKLTLWYTSLLALSLIASVVFLYIAVERAMIAAADARLNFLAETMARTIIKPHAALILPENFDILMEKFFGLKTSGNYIQIMDELGNIKSRSTTLAGFHLPLSSKAIRNAKENKFTYETVDYIGRQPLRIITYPVTADNRLKYVIQIGTSIESVQSTLNDIIYIFYLIIPVVIILATIVGFILASRALLPVNEITMLARKIEAENLNERIATFGTGDEIDKLAETFNDMIARLETSFKSIKQFTSDASHELRTPLAILKGETEVALKSCSSMLGFRDVLKSNLEEVNRMSQIVNNLLIIAKTDMKIELEFEDVRLDEIIDEKFRQTRHIADEKGIAIKLLKNEEIIIKGDPLQLRQLILNLIENAVKYTPEKGNVAISLEEYEGNALIKISDTGVGIANEDMPHIFDRFYRVDKGRARAEGGTGLGLSICKEIAASHGGRIEVKSEIGKGSMFMVYIPMKITQSSNLKTQNLNSKPENYF